MPPWLREPWVGICVPQTREPRPQQWQPAVESLSRLPTRPQPWNRSVSGGTHNGKGRTNDAQVGKWLNRARGRRFLHHNQKQPVATTWLGLSAHHTASDMAHTVSPEASSTPVHAWACRRRYITRHSLSDSSTVLHVQALAELRLSDR